MTEDFSVYTDRFWDGLNADAHRLLMADMAHSLDEELHPTSVLDVGAGLGTLLGWFMDKKRTVYGIESSHARTYVMTLSEGLAPYFHFGDLTEDPASWPPAENYDLAVSIELAEHLPRDLGPRLVEYLTHASNWVWFSGAFPGQGGDGHINERPEAYWEDLFRERGFAPHLAATERIRFGYEHSIGGEWWYRRCRLYGREP